MKILIVIPTLNEKQNISKIYSKISRLKKNFISILFVDDNSTDGTQNEILKISKKNVNYMFRKIKGIGSAHKDGIKWAIKNKYDYCVTMDSDGTHDPKLILKMIKIMKKSLNKIHIINTNRFLKKNSLEGWPFTRIIITKLRFILVKIFLKTKLDSSGGFRLYNLKKIDEKDFELAKNNEYFFLVESLYYFERMGFKIFEIPIKLKFRDYGSSKMRFYHVFNSLCLLISLSFKRI